MSHRVWLNYAAGLHGHNGHQILDLQTLVHSFHTPDTQHNWAKDVSGLAILEVEGGGRIGVNFTKYWGSFSYIVRILKFYWPWCAALIYWQILFQSCYHFCSALPRNWYTLPNIPRSKYYSRLCTPPPPDDLSVIKWFIGIITRWFGLFSNFQRTIRRRGVRVLCIEI